MEPTDNIICSEVITVNGILAGDSIKIYGAGIAVPVFTEIMKLPDLRGVPDLIALHFTNTDI